MNKIQKILFSFMAVTLLLPFIFTRPIGSGEFTVPDMSLFIYPISFLIALIVYTVWKKV